MHVRVRVHARLFARGERWLGHGQGDALIFPWGRKRGGRRCDALKLHLAGHATNDESRIRVRGPSLLPSSPFPTDIARALYRDRIR